MTNDPAIVPLEDMMMKRRTGPARRSVRIGLAMGLALMACAAGAAGTGATVKILMSRPLPNVDGTSLTVVLVRYPPGGQSAIHHHAGSVFPYVVSGAIRSQVSNEAPARVYTAGENFFEPPGNKHLVSANASTTEPASLLAVFVAKTGAQLTTCQISEQLATRCYLCRFETRIGAEGV